MEEVMGTTLVVMGFGIVAFGFGFYMGSYAELRKHMEEQRRWDEEP
jgi:hypothetical protein